MNAGFIVQVDSSTMTVKFASLVLGGIGQYPVSTSPKCFIYIDISEYVHRA